MTKRIDFMPVYAALATLDDLACSLSIGSNSAHGTVFVFDHAQDAKIVMSATIIDQAGANAAAGRIIRREWES